MGGGETMVEVEISEPDYNNTGIVTACPILNFRKDYGDEFSKAKVACSSYEFSGGGKFLKLLRGPDIRKKSIVDIYQKEFRRLGREQ